MMIDDSYEIPQSEFLTGDTDNATKIPVDEAPAHKQEKFKRFRQYNTGLYNGPKRENKEATFRQDNLYTYDAIASSLDLTEYQKKRGRTILDDLYIREFGKPIEHIAFGICCIVANRDVDDGTRYWPHPDAKGDREFENVAENLGISQSEQLSVVQQVNAKTCFSSDEVGCPVDGCHRKLKPSGVKSHVINTDDGEHGASGEVPEEVEF